MPHLLNLGGRKVGVVEQRLELLDDLRGNVVLKGGGGGEGVRSNMRQRHNLYHLLQPD